MTRALLFIFLLLAGPLAVAQSGYTLGAGDSIRVYVYGEPDLTFENLLIGQNGRIAYPFLGELKVAGSTPADLQHRAGPSLGSEARASRLARRRITPAGAEQRRSWRLRQGRGCSRPASLAA